LMICSYEFNFTVIV